MLLRRGYVVVVIPIITVHRPTTTTPIVLPVDQVVGPRPVGVLVTTSIPLPRTHHTSVIVVVVVVPTAAPVPVVVPVLRGVRRRGRDGPRTVVPGSPVEELLVQHALRPHQPAHLEQVKVWVGLDVVRG